MKQLMSFRQVKLVMSGRKIILDNGLYMCSLQDNNYNLHNVIVFVYYKRRGMPKPNDIKQIEDAFYDAGYFCDNVRIKGSFYRLEIVYRW